MTIETDGTAVGPGFAEAGKGHPPEADKKVLVDFDGTIVPWGPLMGPKTPRPAVIWAMKDLADEGYTIVIFTSRMSESWLKSAFGIKDWRLAKSRQAQYVGDILNSNGIPWDYMTAEKEPAEAYFDDKAYAIRENYPLDWAIAEFLYVQRNSDGG
jgi:hypothetical protein